MLRIIEEHCRDRINNFLTKDGLRVVELARVLGFAINAAVKVVLPTVGDLQKWLRVLAKASVDQGKAPSWVTPNGMKVLSYGMETSEHSMYLELSGRLMKISCGLDDGKLSKQKSYSRLTADYIHSMDAAFLERFIWHWKAYEYPLVTVHDCIGTSLDKVSLLSRELTDQFSRFYSEDHLSNLKQRVEDETGQRMPWAPYKNTLELHEIGENPHLFC
jgi:DNA-directed RNA polymerase